ncbi:GNAT family N-acetyltransferase [Myxococcota bacterium]|nr:GNAT family N-acetyltransferase [Myxococcota bacterium]
MRCGGGADRREILGLADEALAAWGQFGAPLAAWLSHPGVRTFVAVGGDTVAGFLMVGLVPVLGGRSRVDAEVLAVAVWPAARGRGVGDLLMGEAVAWLVERARVLPIRRVGLSTAVDNGAAQTLFRRHGFEVAGVRRRYYSTGQDAYRMFLRLSPRGGP